jgi:hypothetical protein
MGLDSFCEASGETFEDVGEMVSFAFIGGGGVWDICVDAL